MLNELALGGTVTENGIVSEALRFSLAYGATEILVQIPQGTRALDEAGSPLETIILRPVVEISELPVDWRIVGLAFDLSPHGAVFNPPLSVSLGYDIASCPRGIPERDLAIACYDAETGKWTKIECIVNAGNGTVTGRLSHLALVAIVGEITPLPPSMGWWVIAVAVIAVVVIGIAATNYVLWRSRPAIR